MNTIVLGLGGLVIAASTVYLINKYCVFSRKVQVGEGSVRAANTLIFDLDFGVPSISGKPHLMNRDVTQDALVFENQEHVKRMDQLKKVEEIISDDEYVMDAKNFATTMVFLEKICDENSSKIIIANSKECTKHVGALMVLCLLARPRGQDALALDHPERSKKYLKKEYEMFDRILRKLEDTAKKTNSENFLTLKCRGSSKKMRFEDCLRMLWKRHFGL